MYHKLSYRRYNLQTWLEDGRKLFYFVYFTFLFCVEVIISTINNYTLANVRLCYGRWPTVDNRAKSTT